VAYEKFCGKMLRRTIPCLLISKGRLVKTISFKNPKYIGDPLNAVKIYNDKEVDELVFLDISASKNNTPIDFDLLYNIASQSFMPLTYGGGVKTLEDMRKVFRAGFEKVCINNILFTDKSIIAQAAKEFGSQSIIVSIDVKKNLIGLYRVYNHVKKTTTKIHPSDFAKEAEKLGAGEIFINSVDRDGMMNGYDKELIRLMVSDVGVPVIGCGGAESIQDIKNTFWACNPSALAAGSLFIYHNKDKAVLINYPGDIN
jgi:imidazole glycerol-phosphate synthase subunit HisF